MFHNSSCTRVDLFTPERSRMYSLEETRGFEPDIACMSHITDIIGRD